MSKWLEITIVDRPFVDHHDIYTASILSENVKLINVDAIKQNTGKSFITYEDLTTAVNYLLIKMVNEGVYNIEIDIDTFLRDQPRKLTLKEIEEKLGYKVEIMEEKKDE